jgi:Flp pilus assembly pilin Flp
MRHFLARLHIALLVDRSRDERGASLVEYSMLIAFIALACFSVLGYFGAETGGSLDDSGQSIITAN